MSKWIRQSTSITEKIGPFLDETDGFTAETALTITQPDVRLSKNGGAFAQKAAAQTLTHDENGYYGCTVDATDSDTLGHLKLHVRKTGALPVWHEFMVVPANVWDSLFGSDKLQIDVAEWLGAAAATPSVAGVPEVDLTHVAGAVINALVSGRMDSSVGAMAAAVVTAAAMATDAITAAKIAAGAITSAEAPNLDAAISTRATPAEVNTEVADVLNTDAQAEVAAVPAANASLSAKVNWLFAQARNKGLQTSTTKTLRNDADSADIATSEISSDGTTFTRNKWT